MVFSQYRFLVLGMAFAVAACGFAEESLWPTLTGQEPSSQNAKSAPAKPASGAPTTAQRSSQVGGTRANAGPSSGPGAKQPPLGNSNFTPSGVTPGQQTGTIVGKKVIELREELKRLQTAVSKQNMQL